jgi:hypothetical protein
MSYREEIVMNSLLRLTAVAAGFPFAMHATAQQVPAGVVMFDISKVQWEKSPTGENAKIVGDQSKPGPYVFLTKPRAAPGLKPGSFYTEPAGVSHFVVIKDEGVIVQISGTGPSRLIPVGEAAKK